MHRIPKYTRKEVSSSSDSDDSSDSSDSEVSEEETGIKYSRDEATISEQRSGTEEENASESEPDEKDQFLLAAFQPKEIKSRVSVWAKKTVRGPFLGMPLGQDEKIKIMDDYYCSTEDHKLFAPPRVVGNYISALSLFLINKYALDSPLALMTNKDSTALKDLTLVHSELLLSMRIALLPFEEILQTASAWQKERPATASKKGSPGGKWANLSYRLCYIS